MDVLTYDEFFEKRTKLSINGERELKRKMALKYGSTLIEEEWLKIQQQLYVLSGCVDNLEGKNILDLGCGCNYSFCGSDRNRAGQTYAPWLCRALHELGVRAIGVDRGNLNGEIFKYHGGVDLSIPRSLDFIPDSSIDVANARLLFSSPELNGNSDTLKQALLPQLERIVKSGGYFVYQD